MEYKKLASTDLELSRVGFGCWAIGGHGWGKVDDQDSIAAIRRALELGINFFDTADVYGFGHSEEVLSAALGEERKRVVVATKFGVRWDDRGTIMRDIRPLTVVLALEDSLRRLRLDCIPLYQIHWPDNRTPISSTMEALIRCQEAGKVRYIGCCNFPAELVRETQKTHSLVSLQMPYNLLDRRIEDTIFPWYNELGVSILSYSPLAQGLLSGKYGPGAKFGGDDIRSRSAYFQKEKYEANLNTVFCLKKIGGRYGKTPAQVAVRWILDNPRIASAITGAKTPEQIEENVGALNWQLSQADWELLAHISREDSET